MELLYTDTYRGTIPMEPHDKIYTYMVTDKRPCSLFLEAGIT
jgi:hypothetical protein